MWTFYVYLAAVKISLLLISRHQWAVPVVVGCFPCLFSIYPCSTLCWLPGSLLFSQWEAGRYHHRWRWSGGKQSEFCGASDYLDHLFSLSAVARAGRVGQQAWQRSSKISLCGWKWPGKRLSVGMSRGVLVSPVSSSFEHESWSYVNPNFNSGSKDCMYGYVPSVCVTIGRRHEKLCHHLSCALQLHDRWWHWWPECVFRPLTQAHECILTHGFALLVPCQSRCSPSYVPSHLKWRINNEGLSRVSDLQIALFKI